ncbi:hypothetical protein [Rhodopseudomonas sp. P2A-2r]|uniref:hypothetical protein n=1 Tax=unclassified Rhodopseudomonas TaxID=2638247 RepID=UPI00223466F9|nr:hypothetical protein [Rhodopseudomonas sp. P2A-2r]UZE47880.1 hypothetical protein ONR75_23875 [Rhodopseudomonas sp. P2A-2r]
MGLLETSYEFDFAFARLNSARGKTVILAHEEIRDEGICTKYRGAGDKERKF